LVGVLLVFPAILIMLTYFEDIAETGLHSGVGPLVSFLAAVPRSIVSVASEAGYTGIFALMLAEAAAFPIPSEIILPFAGYLVTKGVVEFWPVIFYTTIAALIGSYVDYYLGMKLGAPFLRGDLRLPYINPDHLRSAQRWFDRYGGIAVAMFRLVPAARVLISFPAGAYGMSKWKFGLYTLAGCLPWNIILVYFGMLLGSSWNAVVEAFRYINLAAYAFLILLVAWLGWKLSAKRRLRR